MNLLELRTAIESDLQTTMDVEPWRNDITNRINRALRETLTKYRWIFRYRTERIYLLQDRTFEAADVQTSPDGRTFRLTPPTEWSALEMRALEGHLLASDSYGDIPSTTTQKLRPAPDAMVIEDARFTAPNIDLKLDPRFVDTPTSSLAPLTFKAVRYGLPLDAMEVLSVFSRDDDRGIIPPLDRPTEHRFRLDPDETGEPLFWVSSPNLVDQYPYPQARRYQYRKIEAPLQAPVGVLAAAGDLLPNTRYQYKVAWAYAGLVSEPSPVLEITTTATDLIVNLSFVEGWSNPLLGRRRLLYRREAEGPWLLATTIIDASQAATFADVGVAIADRWDAQEYERIRDYRTGWARRHIRFWPRPSLDKIVEVTYLAKPRDLVDDSDVPEMPEEHHDLLVHRVVAEVAAAGDGHGLRKYHADRYKEHMKQMARRYLHEGARQYQRHSALGDVLGEPLSTPVVFTGS